MLGEMCKSRQYRLANELQAKTVEAMWTILYKPHNIYAYRDNLALYGIIIKMLFWHMGNCIR